MRGSDIARLIDEEYRKKQYYKNRDKKIKNIEIKNGVPLIKFEEVEQNTIK